MKQCLPLLTVLESIAKDRAWFRDYTPLRVEAFVTDTLTGSSRLPVVGFGTVEITTQCPPGADNTKVTIHLENVLHVPTAMCNIMGAPFTNSYKIGTLEDNHNILAIKPISSPHNDISDAVGYFDADQYSFRLIVDKAPLAHQLGPYVLSKNAAVHLGIVFPEAEQLRVFGRHI